MTTDTKKDIFNNDIYLNDDVVFIEPYYHNFTNGVVIKFTPKGIRVKYHNSRNIDKETVVYEFIKGRINYGMDQC